MSETGREPPAGANAADAAVAEPAAAMPAQPEAAPAPQMPARERPAPYRAIAIVLAGALLLGVILVAAAPFWAPLLPWGPAAETGKPMLGARLDRLESAQFAMQPQLQQAAAAATAALQRIGALEAKPAVSGSDLADLRRQVAALSSATAELATRVAATDKAVRALATHDTTDAALALVLLQLRDAMQSGRPFIPEYQALAALARDRPQIAKVAATLEEPAKTGVVTRTVLTARLRALAGTIATAQAPPAAPNWKDDVLRHLGRLVTIRRIGGPRQSGPEQAVNAAELALTGGDLTGAVGALAKLTGAPAEAARPWLRMARERLTAEAALHRIEAALSARLGEAGTPAAGGSPR